MVHFDCAKRTIAKEDMTIESGATPTSRRESAESPAPEWATVTGPARVTAQRILRHKRPLTVEKIQEGLNPSTVTLLRSWLDISLKETMVLLGIPRQTMNRRKESGHLSAEESDRVVRYAELIARATELIGDPKDAVEWLGAPAPALGGETPLAHAKTELGAREVFDLVERLEHGIAT